MQGQLQSRARAGWLLELQGEEEGGGSEKIPCPASACEKPPTLAKAESPWPGAESAQGIPLLKTIAAAPAVAASLPATPRGGKTQPTASNTSGMGLLPPSPGHRRELPVVSG